MREDSTWREVEGQLLGRLHDLGPGDYLVVGEPTPPPSPRRGLLRRRPPVSPTAYAQARSDGDYWYAECTGSELFGGDLDLTDAQHERLTEIGWLVPGQDDPSGVQPSYPNYWRVLDREQTPQLARMCREALETLGVDPHDLEWRSG